MPRELREAPQSTLDAHGRPCFGSYAGGVLRVELPSVSRLTRLARRKRWLYLAIASEELYVAFAAVDVSYASNAFFFVYDANAKSMLAQVSVLGSPRMIDFADALPRAGGIEVRHRALAARVVATSTGIDLDVRTRAASLEASLDRAGAPDAITAIAPQGEGVQITEKAALMRCRGRLRTPARTREIEGIAGYDFSHGLLERHTAWKWAFLLGRAKDGSAIAVNLVSGFVGRDECVAWTERGIFPLEEGHFDFDRQRPMTPWSVHTDDGARLRFIPGAMHQEQRNLGVVRSRFVQPVGAWSGTLALPGTHVEIDTALGVAEDQDVVW